MLNCFSTLIALTPLVAAAPFASVNVRDSNPGCQKNSFGDFKWIVKDFDYHASYIFSTPSHQISNGYVSFNLTNPALAYDASCQAISSQLQEFFYGNMIYTCTVPDGSTTETTFDFSRPSGRLDVNQTWTCSDQDPKYPSTIHAFGTANLTLDCTDKTQENPDWQMGQIYSSRTVQCTKVTVPMPPYELRAVA